MSGYLSGKRASLDALFGANHDVAGAGHWNSGELALDDLSHPSAAAELGSTSTVLAGIDGLSIDANWLLAGANLTSRM